MHPRIRGGERRPGVERQHRFGGTSRSGIARDRPPGSAVQEEENQIDGNVERIPLFGGDRHPRPVPVARRHESKPLPVIALERCRMAGRQTRAACAQQPSRARVDDMPVIIGERCTAKIAARPGGFGNGARQ